jgi:hypothetical protein
VRALRVKAAHGDAYSRANLLTLREAPDDKIRAAKERCLRQDRARLRAEGLDVHGRSTTG